MCAARRPHLPRPGVHGPGRPVVAPEGGDASTPVAPEPPHPTATSRLHAGRSKAQRRGREKLQKERREQREKRRGEREEREVKRSERGERKKRKATFTMPSLIHSQADSFSGEFYPRLQHTPSKPPPLRQNSAFLPPGGTSAEFCLRGGGEAATVLPLALTSAGNESAWR